VSEGADSPDVLERLVDKLIGSASVATVYGSPITAGGVTVIPVAEVAHGFGGGSGREAGGPRRGEGLGGGGGVRVRPVGFIQVGEGTAAYTPIRRPWRDAAPALAALAGLAAGAVLSSWRRGR
jgi:uncharacterized spore protein YtfJ